MKRDLYLIAEAYNKKKVKPAVKSNKIPNEYVLFFGIYNKAFSNRYAEGRLIKYSDLTEHEKGLLKLMSRYATTGDFKAYEMKGRAYLKYTSFIAFVGSEESIRDIFDSYKRDYGSDFDFEERKPLPMKKKTKKHFGDIFVGLKESKDAEPELYALILHLKRKDSEKDYYFLKKLEDLNEEEKRILESEEGRITSFKPGVHKFREYYPGKPNVWRDDNFTGKRILMYVAPKDILKRELSYYKIAYGKNLEPGVTVKPKTKEVFGDIVGGLQESFKGTKGIEVLDISVKGCIKKESKWQQPVLVNQVAEYIISMKAEPSNVWRGDKEYYIDISVAEFEPMERDDRSGLQYSYRRVKEWNFGSFNDANQIGWRWYSMYEKEIIREIKKYKALKEMKPKTKKHFGNIISGLQESKEEEYVLVQRFKFDQNGIYKNGKYQLKPSKNLTKEERDSLQKLERMHSYMDGYRGFDVDGYDEFNMIFGTKEYLEDEIEETKKYMIGGSFKEEIPMKPKTKESFADIFDKLNESKKKEKQEAWVLIIKFNRIKSSKFNDYLKYTICPFNELSKKNKEIYDKATNWLRPAYNKRVELNIGPHVGGIDMGDYKAEVFRGPEDAIKSELESHKRVYKMEEDVPVPMKDETEKHFGGVV